MLQDICRPYVEEQIRDAKFHGLPNRLIWLYYFKIRLRAQSDWRCLRHFVGDFDFHPCMELIMMYINTVGDREIASMQGDPKNTATIVKALMIILHGL
jgi:hypothetical protein